VEHGKWYDGSRGNLLVQIIHPNEERFEKIVRELVAVYKEQFQQESVLRVTARSCVSF
jgi:hypothetical protein